MHWCKLILLLLLCPLFTNLQSQSTYQKVRIDLSERSFNSLMQMGIDYDHAHPYEGRYVDLELDQSSVKLLKDNHWKFKVLVDDLEAYYQKENRPSEINDIYSRSFSCKDFECDAFIKYNTPQNYKFGSMGGFYTYGEMLNILDEMQSKYPHLISIKKPISNLKTHEGNNILFVRISNNPDTKQNKPEVLYSALHHAREPNSLSQMIFFMWHLLENYDRDGEVTSIINNTELYFMPCVNPDGYIHNNTNSPNGGGMWRKNKRKNSSGNLVGVDLNRNYGFNWGNDDEGSSPNPASEVYRGPEAFSEPETRAMSEFISAHNFTVNLNYHTHGNYLVHPWGYTSDPNPDANKFRAFGKLLTRENCFLSGTGEETVGYRTNGDSDDWMYGETTTKNRVFSFTPEVGKSFYPIKDDIIYLNKSVMDMNLKMPKVARNYSEATPIALPIGLTKETRRLAFEVTKLGFRNDPVRIVLQLDKGVALNTGNRQVEMNVNLATGQKDTVYFNFELNNDLLDGENVTFKYTVYYDEFGETNDLVLKYFRSSTSAAFDDNFENDWFWKVTGDWGRTNILKYDGTYSLTDSPSALYKSGSRQYATLAQSLDLSNVHKAKIKFNARWAIEKDFDYAQIQVSTDGVNFLPLCGKFTRTNNINEVVYDGFQTEWIQEDIDISDYVGFKNVSVRFALVADDLNNFDGMYIDNFKIEVVQKFSTSNEESVFDVVKISPNPTSDFLKITSAKGNYQIYNNIGQVVQKGVMNSEFLDVRSLFEGVYFITLVDEQTKPVSLKFIKQ
ncbi:MAG TPA: M14 family zinc carboxypeptidase [Saprospiraceae bacterium]|nr:M14 family zinc carboxypeptidase [Saprospiraceae bacterium]HPN68881.1 M14 family zinc carboxypeptidase [Saprospiraceae bacterium]